MSRSGNVWDKRRDGKLLLIVENGAHRTQKLIGRGMTRRADVFDYIECFYKREAQALDNRLYEPGGVRKRGQD